MAVAGSVELAELLSEDSFLPQENNYIGEIRTLTVRRVFHCACVSGPDTSLWAEGYMLLCVCVCVCGCIDWRTLWAE